MKTVLLWYLKNLGRMFFEMYARVSSIYHIFLINRKTHGAFFTIINAYHKHTNSVNDIIRYDRNNMVWDFVEKNKTSVSTIEFVYISMNGKEGYISLDTKELDDPLTFDINKEGIAEFKESFKYYLQTLAE